MEQQNEKPEKTVEELKGEYVALGHAVQSGVAQKMFAQGSEEIGETSPKHLRVGVNMSLIDSAAVASLLMKKGVFTELEYYEELNELLRREVESYERDISRHYGTKTKITLK